MTPPKHPIDFALWIAEQINKAKSFSVLAYENAMAENTIKKYFWVSTWPKEILKTTKELPDIFTARIIISGFASRQRFYKKNNWEKLLQEVQRLIKKGAGNKPRKALNYPRGRAGGSLSQQRQRQIEKNDIELSHNQKSSGAPSDFLQETCAQDRLRDRLATWVSVGNGEIRIKYYDKDDLERVVEIIEEKTREFSSKNSNHIDIFGEFVV